MSEYEYLETALNRITLAYRDNFSNETIKAEARKSFAYKKRDSKDVNEVAAALLEIGLIHYARSIYGLPNEKATAHPNFYQYFRSWLIPHENEGQLKEAVVKLRGKYPKPTESEVIPGLAKGNSYYGDE